MGIVGIVSYLEEDSETFSDVCLDTLSVLDTRKLIVVDGNTFIASYLLKHFQWIVGGTIEFVDIIHDFVKSFENIGLTLIFFFQESSPVETNSILWNKACRLSMECGGVTLNRIKRKTRRATNLNFVWPNHRFRPHDLHCWTISVLRDFNCEVICTLKDRVLSIANFARVNSCLAILTQSSYFVFFEALGSLILSLSNLDLIDMSTKAYDSYGLTKRLNIDRKFYPLLAALLGTTENFNYDFRKQVMGEIARRVNLPDSTHPCILASTYIKENYDPLALDRIPIILTEHFFLHNGEILMKSYQEFHKTFHLAHSDNLIPNEFTLNKWEKIKMECVKLYISGKMCVKIFYIIHKQIFEQFITIEDFLNFPPLCLIYKALRKELYGILLHEAAGFVESVDVKEWRIDGKDSQPHELRVCPTPIDPSLHPGLLILWNFTNDSQINQTRWRLFAAAVSPSLDHVALQNLKESFVVPVTLLHYLFNEVPKFINIQFHKWLRPWEIEVFIAVALTLPFTSKEFLRSTNIGIVNARTIVLTSLFIQGCDIIKLLIRSCGLQLEESQISVTKYFDGKLFQFLYERVRSGTRVIRESSRRYSEFDKLKDIVFIFPKAY